MTPQNPGVRRLPINPRNTSGCRVTRRHFRKSGRVSFVRGALPNYKTCIYLSQTIQYMQNNLNMSKNASWAHKLLLIKSIIITILQLSPNNSIVDNTFVLYKHILKSTILIHVVSKNHQATNRLLQNQPQNELSPRALHVPEI